jgi:hypothetical protein
MHAALAALVRSCVANSLYAFVSFTLLCLLVAPAGAQVLPAAPCCGIAAIDAKTGIVTGKVHQTGQTFTFELQSKQQTSQLKIGQGVYANFTTKQVSLDGRTIAGKILSIGAAISLPTERTGQVSGSPGSTPSTSGKRAMVIVVEGGQTQAHSVKREDFFKAMQRVMNFGLGDLELDLPPTLQDALGQVNGLKDDLVKAVRQALKDMLLDAVKAEQATLGNGTTQRCLADMLSSLGQAVASAPDSGSAFLDRYGEAMYAACFRDMAKPYYEKVVVLTDTTATYDNFKATLEQLHQQGYTMDVLLDIHGCGDSTVTNTDWNNLPCDLTGYLYGTTATTGTLSPKGLGNGHGLLNPGIRDDAVLVFTEAFPSSWAAQSKIMEINGGKPMNLNAVYMVSCWGSNFDSAWRALGAKGANGSKELNYYVLLSPLVFLHYWTRNGMSLTEASSRGYEFERVLLNGKTWDLKFDWWDLFGKKHTETIPIGLSWGKLINKALAKQYGADSHKPINNVASSARIVGGDPAVRR